MTDELEDQIIAKTEELTEEKKGEPAVQEATELAKIDPRDAIVWLVKGKAHYVNKQFEEALASFSKAAEIDKENPRIWHMMGYCLLSMNRLSEAEECLLYVKEAQKANAEAVCALGICQSLMNKRKEAKENIDLAMALEKKTALSMIEHCYENCFSLSKDTSSSTKALIERVLETLKLVR